MKEVRIGLIGTGYIGKAHAIAYAQAPTVFNLRGKLVREMVAEVNPALAAERAQAFGFNRSTGDWRVLVADPLSPIHWHCFKETAGLGALGDLAAHIVNMAQYLVGEIEQVCGDLKIVVPARPAKAGSSEMVTVENEDQAHAMVRFAGGAQGVIETSRVACGRKMGLSYVITGTKGAISFTQERMAEDKALST